LGRRASGHICHFVSNNLFAEKRAIAAVLKPAILMKQSPMVS
jgi:hypothetical protein